MIDRYVKDNLFNDDQYDPIESIYREAFDDATKGTYPQALRKVAAEVLGEDPTARPRDMGVGSWLTSTIAALKKRGLSESSAILVLASIFVVAGPSVFLFVGMIVGGISKRNIRNVMKKRYGDTYTTDATIKTEEEVEAPDDSEDDDDDDEDSGDEEDDDDDDK